MFRESALLGYIAQRSNTRNADCVIVGPGDDCAIVNIGNQPALITTDQLIEGRHYDPATATLEQIAHKAIARSISDIAAMAGTPSATVATLAAPKSFDKATDLFEAMQRIAKEFGAPLVGGDASLTDGPLHLTTTVFGTPNPDATAYRSDAQAGDEVYITGALGHSYHSGRHLTFEPRLKEALTLAKLLKDQLGAMIDLSDGLGRDAARVASASGVQIELDATALPLHPDTPDWHNGASDGEDYELLFTCPPQIRLPPEIASTPLTRIGTVHQGAGCVIITPDGQRHDATNLGFDHA